MTILSIDTSGPACSAAVSKDGRLLEEVVMNSALTHSETLMPAVERVIESAGLDISDIDIFAAVAGPGSFTGVRIGVCAARAMAHAQNKKCVSVNALHALAAGAYQAKGIICPILDARRQQVYSAAYRYEEGALVRVRQDDALPLVDFIRSLPENETLYFTGDGVAVHEEAIKNLIGNRAVFAPLHARVLRASSACYIASLPEAELIDPERLLPIYLRLPQAERERNEKTTRAKV
ncbi:MAG: tRNA (adenosine(37)-N6)-threonylcarbamoyltransferase complex dimerization subunit type 1 TsaB [Clostridia bacterium]|nr:tRNA (adenosine(37)-N6)-threonylcarbamoyltransferase complex dimerization subunit type 1 TsaB [Clostridia bacterium]